MRNAHTKHAAYCIAQGMPWELMEIAVTDSD
jgi:hypothetical protein